MKKNINTEKTYYFTWGGHLKTASDAGLLEGHGIVFGSEDQPDRSNYKDFFTADTFVHTEDSFTVPLFLEHGFKYRKSIGKALMFKTDYGWDVSAELNMDNSMVKSKFSDIKAGGWGFSTGSVGHLVDREKKANGTHHIQQWVPGEISLTTTPAEERALIYSVKSIGDYYDMATMPLDDMEDPTNMNTDMPAIDPMHQSLMDIINLLISQMTKKNIEELVIPQLMETLKIQTDLIQVKLDELKVETSLPMGEMIPTEELTVLKSSQEELQSSLLEKEALLSEKMVLLSETQAELEAKSQEVSLLEEALKSSQDKITSLETTNRALAVTNYKI